MAPNNKQSLKLQEKRNSHMNPNIIALQINLHIINVLHLTGIQLLAIPVWLARVLSINVNAERIRLAANFCSATASLVIPVHDFKPTSTG